MSQYIDITLPSGSTFNNATVKGFEAVAFKDTPRNQYDGGIRTAQKGEYKILSVVDRSKEDTAPFLQYTNVDGFSVKIGTIANIELIKDVKNSIPNELIIMTGNTGIGGGWGNTGNTGAILPPSNANSGGNVTIGGQKNIFTPKNVVISIVIIGVIFGILKITKVI